MARFDTDWNAGHGKRREQRAKLRVFIVFIVVCFLVVGGLYAIFRTKLLRVQAVTIEGVTYTDPALIKNALMAERPGLIGSMAGFRNMLAWPSELSSSTRALIPSAQTLVIHKSYIRRTITVEVVERQPFGIWCFSKTEVPSCLWFDQNGVVYSPAFYTEGSLIPIVRDTAQDQAGQGRTVLPERLLPNFLSVLAVIREEHIPMREIRLTDIGKEEVEIPTYSGPGFYFSLRFAPTNVPLVLADLREKGSFETLQYIDFRSENRAFYQ